MRNQIVNFVVKGRVIFYFLGGVVLLFELGMLLTSVPRQVEEIQSLSKSNEEISKDVEQLDRAVKVLSAVDQSKLAKELARVNAVLPSQKKTSGLVAGIAKVASDSGVVLKELDFSPGKFSTNSAEVTDEPIAGSKVRRVAASVTIVGDLDKVMAFLTKIQAASQLIGTESLAFQGVADRQQTTNITLQVYYEPVSSQVIDWSQVRQNSAGEEKVLQSLGAADIFIVPEEGR